MQIFCMKMYVKMIFTIKILITISSPDWSPIVKLGVVNCADEENVKLCRKLNVDGVPDMRVS